MAFSGARPLAFPRFPDLEGRRPEESGSLMAFAGSLGLAFPRFPDFEGREV